MHVRTHTYMAYEHNYINNTSTTPIKIYQNQKFLYLKTTKIINGGCVTIKHKITYRTIIYTPNLNLMLFFFSILYVHVFTFILRNIKSKLKLEFHCM
jgi:hypothetical protein